MGICCYAFDKHWILFFIHVTFTAIAPGVPRRGQNALGWLQKLTHVPLVIAILLIVDCVDLIGYASRSSIARVWYLLHDWYVLSIFVFYCTLAIWLLTDDENHSVMIFTCVSYAEARNSYRLDVCPSVCPSHACIVSKRLNILSCFLRHTIAHSF